MPARRKIELGVAAIAGLTVPLAFAPFEWFWLAPFSYAALIYLWTDRTPRRAFALGFVFGCASFGAGTYWTFIAVRVFGEAPIALAAFLTVGLTVVLALFLACAGYVAARWLRTSGAMGRLVAVPAVWLLAEWLRGWLFSGFGWLAPGYSQTESWLMGFAPIAGVHAMTWLVLLTAGALVALVAPAVRATPAAARAALGTRVAAAGVLAAVFGASFAVRNVEWTAPTGRTLDVALVQGAITQDIRWNPEQLPPTRALYAELTATAAGADLILWPEAAIPSLYEYERRYLDAVRRLVHERGSTVLTGILRQDPRTTEPAYQNVLVALTEEPQIYVKRHLVPFGEYFPVPSFIREWMRLMSLPYTDVEPGDAGQPALDVAGEKVAVTICYEDVFGAEQLHYLPEATLLVNVSNDGWFGDSLAPHQHLQIARVRAAEAGRWLLRATNTGVSAVIDPRGRAVATIPLFEQAVLEHTVESYAGATPYARVGNYPVVLGALVLALVPLAGRRRAVRNVIE